MARLILWLVIVGCLISVAQTFAPSTIPGLAVQRSGLSMQAQKPDPSPLRSTTRRSWTPLHLWKDQSSKDTSQKGKLQAQVPAGNMMEAESALNSTMASGFPFGQLPSPEKTQAWLDSPTVELVEFALVFYGCLLIAVQTLDLIPVLEKAIEMNEDALSLVFLADYVVRWYAKDFKPRYLGEVPSLLDFVSILPYFLRLLGAGPVQELFFLRLWRIFKLQRYLQDVESFATLVGGILPQVKSMRPYQLEVLKIAGNIFAALFVTSGLVYVVEHDANSQLNNYFSAFYFSLITLTTVGYGDVVPQTVGGKIVVASSILVGIGVIPLQLSSAIEAILDDSSGATCSRCNESGHKSKANYCWRCGHDLRLPKPQVAYESTAQDRTPQTAVPVNPMSAQSSSPSTSQPPGQPAIQPQEPQSTLHLRSSSSKPEELQQNPQTQSATPNPHATNFNSESKLFYVVYPPNTQNYKP